MKLIIYLCFTYLLVLSSCNGITNKEHIEELQIFGYSGFQLKGPNNHLYTFDYYLDYIQHCDTCDSVKFEYDSAQFDIRRYFEYKKNGSLKVAVRKTMDSTKFYIVLHYDTSGFEKIINRLLLNDSLKSEYVDYNEGRIYDGYSYTLHFKTNNKKERTIYYIPYDLQDSLRFLHDLVNRIVEKNKKHEIVKFEYNQITESVAKKQFKNHPPPHLFHKIIKYVPPEVKPN